MIKANDFLEALQQRDRERAEALFLQLSAEELGRVVSAVEAEEQRLGSEALFKMAREIRRGILPKALFESAKLGDLFPSMFDP